MLSFFDLFKFSYIHQALCSICQLPLIQDNITVNKYAYLNNYYYCLNCIKLSKQKNFIK